MKLYRSLVLPVLDYRATAFVAATDFAKKEFGKVQRSVLIKASGCMVNTRLETPEIFISTPMHLLLKLTQAEEIRIYSRNAREQMTRRL